MMIIGSLWFFTLTHYNYEITETFYLTSYLALTLTYPFGNRQCRWQSKMTNPDIIQAAIRSNLEETDPELFSTLRTNGELEDYLHRKSAEFYRLREELSAANPDMQIETLEEIILKEHLFVERS